MLEKSRKFAIIAHASQKYGDKPYSYHLDSVAKLLQPHGKLAQVIGYLHDVVEDTNITLSELSAEFSSFIADAVSILTDEPGKNRKERKEKTYKKMSRVSGKLELALIVKAADRLSNILACIDFNRLDKLEMYKSEHSIFKKSVYRPSLCQDIWEKIESNLVA